MKRRAFVAATALGVGSAVTLAAAQPVPAGVAAPPAHGGPDVGAPVPFHFDRAAFSAVLEKPYAHRQVMTAVSFADAALVPHYMANSLRAYADPNGFAAGPDALHLAAVLYGRAIAMVLDDAAWAKYPLGAVTAPGKGLPVTAPDLLRKNPHLAEVNELVASHGVTFFVCNNAFSGLAAFLAKGADSAEPSREKVVATHDELIGHFAPGVMLVPAGVAAINAAQEARFTLLQSIA